MNAAIQMASDLLEADGPDDLDPKELLMGNRPGIEHLLQKAGYAFEPRWLKMEGWRVWQKRYDNGMATFWISPDPTQVLNYIVLNFFGRGRAGHDMVFHDMPEIRLVTALEKFEHQQQISESEADELDPKQELEKVDMDDSMFVIWLLKNGFELNTKDNPWNPWYEKVRKYGEEISVMPPQPDHPGWTVYDDARRPHYKYGMTVEQARQFLIRRDAIEMYEAEGGPDDVDPKDYVEKLPDRPPRLAYAFLPSDWHSRTPTISPIIVRENEPGYSQTNWVWNRQHAKQALDDCNAKLGLSPTEAEYILMSSMFPKKGAVKKRRRIKEAGPDDVDPKDQLMSLDSHKKELFSQIKPAADGWEAMQVVLVQSYKEGEWVTRIKNMANGGQSWGHYHDDYDAAVEDWKARCVQYGLPTEPLETRIVYEAGPDDVNPKDYLNDIPARDPRITITFSRTTPESSAEGDVSDSGWINQEGVSMLPDNEDEASVVDMAVEFLVREGAVHASSSHFHPGVWYSTEYYTIDYATGEDEERNFHLEGFTEDEEQEIWNGMHPVRNM